MSAVATAVVGAAVVGGAVNYFSTQAGQEAQQNATNQAIGLQQQQMNNTNRNEAPYQAAGIGALNQINANQGYFNTPFSYSQYQQSPAYQAQLQAGLDAITRSQSASGTLGSGDTGKALMNYGQQAANADYQQAFNNYTTNQNNTYNRLASLAGLGQVGTQTTVNAGTNAANQVGNNVTAMGTAQAAGNIANANSISSGLNSGMNTWMQSQYLNSLNNNQVPGSSSMSGLQPGGFGVTNTGAPNPFQGANPYAGG